MSKFNADNVVNSLAAAILDLVKNFTPSGPLGPQGPTSGYITSALGLTSDRKVNPWYQVISQVVDVHPDLQDYEMIKGPFGGVGRKDRPKKAAKKAAKASEAPSSPTNETVEDSDDTESTENIVTADSAAAE